jgi:hypothetical protein
VPTSALALLLYAPCAVPFHTFGNPDFSAAADSALTNTLSLTGAHASCQSFRRLALLLRRAIRICPSSRGERVPGSLQCLRRWAGGGAERFRQPTLTRSRRIWWWFWRRAISNTSVWRTFAVGGWLAGELEPVVSVPSVCGACGELQTALHSPITWYNGGLPFFLQAQTSAFGVASALGQGGTTTPAFGQASAFGQGATGGPAFGAAATPAAFGKPSSLGGGGGFAPSAAGSAFGGGGGLSFGNIATGTAFSSASQGAVGFGSVAQQSNDGFAGAGQSKGFGAPPQSGVGLWSARGR